MSAKRGTKWHLPPPPAPRILHLPRRICRRSGWVPAGGAGAVRRPVLPPSEHAGNVSGILQELFDLQDRSFDRDATPSPTRVKCGGREDSEEERWRLEAEVLRAECKFLRMEREVALQKLEGSRVQMETALRSAVQTLVSGRKKIDGGQGMGPVLQEEIEELQSKLELLRTCRLRQRSDRKCTSLDPTLRVQSSVRNFDRKASRLRRRLKEMTANAKTKTPSRDCEEEEQQEAREIFVREIREIASESSNVSTMEVDCRNAGIIENTEAKAQLCPLPDWRCRLHDVEILRMKMEGMSKVMLRRMESYDSSLCLPISPSSSSSSSCRAAYLAAGNLKADGPRDARARQLPAHRSEGGRGFCSGRCREVVGRVMEQVRAEAQQWNEMQGMLGQVRREMEDLQCARDFWERCAIASDAKHRAATAQLLDWRQKAQASEHRESELQTRVRELQVDVETLRRELSVRLLHTSSATPAVTTSSPTSSGPRTEPCDSGMDHRRRIKDHPVPPSSERREKQQERPLQQLLLKEKEIRVQLRRPKENQHPSSQTPRSRRPRRRPPFQEIGNAAAFVLSSRT